MDTQGSIYGLCIMHRLANGGWRVEYRTLKSVCPTIDYETTAEMISGIEEIIKITD